MTLAMGRRWMLVEGVERWKDKDVQSVAEALDGLPAGHDRGPDRHRADQARQAEARARRSWSRRSRSAAARSRRTRLPPRPSTPKWTVEQAGEGRTVMSPEAAQALADRVGQDDKRRLHERRLMRELEKIAIYAPEDARVDVETVEELTASDAEARTLRARRRAGRRGHPLAVSACGGPARPRRGHHVRPLRAACARWATRAGLGGAGGGRLDEGRRGGARRARLEGESRSSPRPSAQTERGSSASRRPWRISTTRCAGARTSTPARSSR